MAQQLVSVDRYPEEITNHLAGSIITRFPPEPNGFLHLGHAKAIIISGDLASFHPTPEASTMTDTHSSQPLPENQFLLRYDDTNPSQEKTQYVHQIQRDVEWLGYSPDQITFTSNYFPQMYQMGVQLLEQGHAYVCSLTSHEISQYREWKKPSPDRDRPIAENITLFQEMKNGTANHLSMRMKGDLSDPDPSLWDLVFFRVIQTPHHRTGEQWCVYPTYDFAHCIVDSLEGITHSLCTTEFLSRRKSYFWLLDKLGLRRPLVYEFGKMSLSQSILSKRRLSALVESGVVEGWDDPRMLTLAGLRRRGYPPDIIRQFVRESGINRLNATLPLEKLEYYLREHLDQTAVRRLGVLDPLAVVIVNYSELSSTQKEAILYDFPQYMRLLGTDREGEVPLSRRGVRSVRLTPRIYIESSSFRVTDTKKYYGLAPGKLARLRYSHFIRAVGYQLDSNQQVIQISVQIETPPPNPKKVKGILPWVGESASPVEFRLWKPLLTPQEDTLQEDSKRIVHGLLEEGMTPQTVPNGFHCQVERQGYFILDSETRQDGNSHIILNRSVELRSSYRPEPS